MRKKTGADPNKTKVQVFVKLETLYLLEEVAKVQNRVRTGPSSLNGRPRLSPMIEELLDSYVGVNRYSQQQIDFMRDAMDKRLEQRARA